MHWTGITAQEQFRSRGKRQKLFERGIQRKSGAGARLRDDGLRQ
jgi:hypothetical protein